MTVETIVLNRPIVEIVGEGEVFRRWQTRQGALVFQIASDGITLAESLQLPYLNSIYYLLVFVLLD
jgi:hypothetical protein